MTAPKQELAARDTPVPADIAFIEMVERAAANPQVDVEKLERLLAMKQRIEDRAAERAFNAAMSNAQAEMKPVLRDAINPDNKSRYARLETLIDAINPIITKNGFFMSFGTEDSPVEKHYRVTCLLGHTEGHSREYHADIPADLTGLKGNPNKTQTHAFGSTMSYGRRYLTLLIFNVALVSEDDDGNRAGGMTTINEDQITELRQLIMDVDADLPKLLAYLKIERLEDIYANKFDTVKRLIEQKRREKRS